MTPETKNLIAAMSLSMAILIGWQVFFVKPEQQAEQARQSQKEQQAQTQAQIQDGTPRPTDKATISAAQIIDTGMRIVIDAPLVKGSLSTMGGRVDDIVLTDYAETLDEGAEPVRLFSRFDSPSPYFAEFGWVSDAGEALNLPNAQTNWQTNSTILSADRPVRLTYNTGQGLSFERLIQINEDYLITVQDSVTSSLEHPIFLHPYSLITRKGTPPLTGLFILHEGPLGVFDGTLEEEDYDDLQDLDKKGLQFKPSAPGGWIGITDKYWLAALLPQQTQNLRYSMRAVGADKQTYQTDMIGEAMALTPGQTIQWEAHLFAGAKSLSLLDKYSQDLNIANFDLAIDFGWFYFLTKPFFYAISLLNGHLGNFGLAIIAFTILVRLVLYPLANKSYRSMARMRELSPKIIKMREDYGDDKQKLNQDMMALYKREKVNPAAGCLPILLQIPVFFALYKVLYVSIEMRHAPFYGWIKDLSAVDPTSMFNLFGLLPYSVDMLPQFLSIGVWPILMGISMAVQMRLNPPPPDPIQAKIFQWMPVFFTFLLAGFPAGLVIYWTWNNVLSIAQQWWITRSIQRQSQGQSRGQSQDQSRGKSQAKTGK